MRAKKTRLSIRRAVFRGRNVPALFERLDVVRRQTSPRDLVPDGHPIVAQVVLTRKNLQVPPVRHELFDELVNLRRLLRLPATRSEDDIAPDGSVLQSRRRVSSTGDQAHFLRVLQIKAV